MKAERIAFALAAAAVAAHIVDHLLVGVEFDLQFEGVIALAVVTILAALLYPRLSRRDQVVVATVLGLSWLVGDFFEHALPTVRDGAGPTDYTGLGATLGGAVLIGVGIAAWRRGVAAGGEPPAHPRAGPA